MTAFLSLSAVLRAFFALWALLICLTNIGSAVLAAVRKRFRFMLLSLLIFAPIFFLWQVIFDLSLFGRTEKAAAVSASLGGLPWLVWLTALAALTVASALLLQYHIRYDRNFITPGTIKLFLDRMPCGVCCWHESGRVLFSNVCMNRLYMELTGSRLLNGNHLHQAVPDGIVPVRGKVWRFVSREITMDGERLYELVASDITNEYAKTAALEKDKAELLRLNHELSAYYLSIDDAVRRQEILQAKMNIHDEMNRLMLSTVAADKNDTRALDEIFSMWEQNALLLCREAQQKSSEHEKDDIDALAKALGLRVIWRGDLPDELNGKQKELVFLTAQEAVINAVKHAQAKLLEISFERQGDSIRYIFRNDGIMPSDTVRFKGGLLNLSRLSEQQEAVLTADARESFTLTLTFDAEKSAD